MLVYRFKITFENNDEFLREIELDTNQTFLDFYNILVENILLDRQVQSAFFLSDHKYRKKQGIYHPDSVTQMKGEATKQKQNPIDAPILLMDNCVISDYVDDPHQKFLFIYDLAVDWNFYIELMRIPQGDEKLDYPRVVRSIGKTPVELTKKATIISSTASLEEIDLDELEELEPEPEDIIVYESEEELLVTEEVVALDSEDIDSMGDDQLYEDSVEMDADFDDDDR